MEEILASICRIIESNEPGSSGLLSGQVPPVYDEEDDAVVESSFLSEAISPAARIPPVANQPFGARLGQDFHWTMDR